MSIREEILSKVAEVAGEYLTEIGYDALSALAVEKSDEPLVATVLNIAASWVHQHGAEAAEDLMDKLIDALDGDMTELSNLPDLDALTLAQLTEAYQAAEAKDKKTARKWARKIGAVLRQIGETAGQVLIGSL